MTPFEIIAILLTTVALGGYINHRFVKLPETIGQMSMALVASVVMISAYEMGFVDLTHVKDMIGQIDFSAVVLHGLLSVLLFAGALHVNLEDLRTVKWSVSILSTLGVIIAALVTGTLVWYLAQFAGLPLSYTYALLFGALISPTDPIAVLAMLKQAKVSKNLASRIGGESLFNDGVGVVLFLAVLGVATGQESFNGGHFAVLLAKETLGGAALGVSLGYLTFVLLKPIDDYKVEIMLTLALVTGGYALAEFVHVSAPICMVCAGLVIGNHGRKQGMSVQTRERLDLFWELLDEVCNSVLFMLIGLELIIITLAPEHFALGLMAALAVLFGRYISVLIPVSVLRLIFSDKFERGTVRILTWGGLRGGISIAMALSLPAGAEKDIILPVTYTVVLFSILVQGLSFPKVLKMLLKQGA